MKFDLGKKKLTEIHTSSDSSMIDDRKKKSKKKTRKPAKKSRTKTRKPKFLSLSLQLSSQKVKLGQGSTDMPSNSSTNDHQQQLNLFPLHPENLVEDHHNMAYLFSAAADGGAASTLTGLLGSGTTSSSSVSPSASASLSYAYGSEVKEAVELVRTALRNKERDSSEERYVRYSEVVERRDEEVTSTAVDRNLMMVKVEKQRLLSLKLDYEQILNVWSDKGPLYVYAAAESPQTVPDIHDNFLPHGLSKGVSDHAAGCGGSQSHGGLWSVPELTKGNQKVHEEIKKEEEQEQEEWKVGRREASVQRYKEKRQNRLFSKTIRYQVRKLNAENRPRVKGRFVKRS